ncbi:glycerol-3-phosphate 1-O-acyltransferase [Prolixibacteraceae bacterium JC049]|nr:glycerol-3-phosphate 1-O-acyltransferase [Prolixibacteraceae bacterium JC049]
MTIFNIALTLLSYILGSIPFGLLLTFHFTGKDVRTLGSGNIGSTNVKRVAGFKVSLYTQLCDMAKGLIPVLTCLVLSRYYADYFSQYSIYAVALATILGHNFSLFLRLKGGKGVNTTLGASLLIAPLSVFIGVVCYFIVKYLFKYVSLGSLFLAISLPVSWSILQSANITFYYLMICTLLIIFTHKSNLKRLMDSKELNG